MNLTNVSFTALAIVMTASVASTADASWPRSSASDLSIFVAKLRFQLYADHCSAKVPQLKPKFESLMENLNSHIQDISKGLLASDAFKGMKDKPVPVEIIDSFKDSFDDVRHNFERLDAASTCPQTLQNFAAMDDESLKSGLTDILTAVRNMIRNLENASVR